MRVTLDLKVYSKDCSACQAEIKIMKYLPSCNNSRFGKYQSHRSRKKLKAKYKKGYDNPPVKYIYIYIYTVILKIFLTDQLVIKEK